MKTHIQISTLWLTLVIGVAAGLRLWALGSLPPGLYRDEAFNGLDALGILKGDWSLYFAANNGREPLFFYLLAASIGTFGRNPLALRLPAAFVSLLTVPAFYLMARALWGRRVGLLSAAVLAVMVWPIHLAHVGFRAGLLPLCLALTTWQAARGWQSGARRHWLAAGCLYGLSFYTYLAARFTPLGLAVFAGYAWWAFLRRSPADQRRALQGAGWFAAAAGAVVLPLVVFGLFHWDIVMGRVGQASVFNPAIHGGNLPGVLAGNVLKALGMFFVSGDRIYRHNMPWRPVFDPLLGLFFAVGVILALRRLGRDAGAGLALTWTFTLLLPTVLAEDSPHFLRAVGVLPVIAAFPALGLDLVLRRLPFSRPAWSWLLVAGALALSLGSSLYDYFGRYPQDPKTAYWFDAAGVALAQDALDVLQSNVLQSNVLPAEGSPPSAPVARVLIERRLWQDWVNARFLLADRPVMLFDLNQSPAVSGASMWMVWPYDDWSQIWPALPQRSRLEIHEGALYQGDREPEPHVAYLSFHATPYAELPTPRARFEQTIQLLEAGVTPVGDRLRVRLVWYTQTAPPQPFIVFVHLLQAGQRLAQADGPPAGGYYPAQVWRPGDVIVDEHWLDAPALIGDARVMVGLYVPETGQRLSVLDETGQAAADAVVLDVEGK